MLDPIKVTLLTPGIDSHGTLAAWGIPGRARLAVPRDARHRRREDRRLHDAVPLLDRHHAGQVGHAGRRPVRLQEPLRPRGGAARGVPRPRARTTASATAPSRCPMLGDEMHAYLLQTELPRKLELAYETLPEPVMPPDVAYENLVRGKVEMTAACRDGRPRVGGDGGALPAGHPDPHARRTRRRRRSSSISRRCRSSTAASRASATTCWAWPWPTATTPRRLPCELHCSTTRPRSPAGAPRRGVPRRAIDD